MQASSTSNHANGRLIVLEGTDGSGKATQFRLLADKLRQDGFAVATFDFPQYVQPSSYFVQRYLNGQYGTAEAVGPYTASLFYSLDRYDSADEMRQAIADGKIVLVNRFAGSNMAHQGAKFDKAAQRRGFFIWLDNLEFETLKIPRPDINIVLRVPADIAQGLVDRKGERSYTKRKRDIHEADLNHLQRSVEVYDDLCQLFPKDFSKIECFHDGKLLSVDQVASLIYEKIQPYLPSLTDIDNGTVSATSLASVITEQPALRGNVEKKGESQFVSNQETLYVVPGNFDAATKQAYCQVMDTLLSNHQRLLKRLSDHLSYHLQPGKTKPLSRQAEAQAVAARVLPLAATSVGGASFIAAAQSRADNAAALATIAQQYTRTNHAASSQRSARLQSYWPRNELDIVADLLYSNSDLSYQQLQADNAAWAYDHKSQVISSFTKRVDDLSNLPARYAWEIVDSFAALRELQRLGIIDITSRLQVQGITPRLGYQMPPLIEEANLAELYEDCFDRSLQLHSLLQANDYPVQAALAVLAGHTVRWMFDHTAQQAAIVHRAATQSQPNVVTQNLLQQLHDKLTEVHPLLSAA